MFQLEASQTLSGVAGTASAVTATVNLNEVTMTDTFKAPQIFVPSSVGTLYTAAAGGPTLVKSLILSNTTGSQVTGIKLYKGATSAVNQITGTFAIPANGTAIYTGEVLSVVDGTGALVYSVPLDPSTPTTIDPDDAAVVGTSLLAAHGDHQHAIATDVAGTIQPDDSASEGVSSSFSRADHRHAVAAAAPGAIAVGDASTEGASTSFARADHTHTLTAPAAPANVTKAAASAGAATTVARSDHKHDVTTAAAGTIAPDDVAAEGSASSLARSDHTHAIAAAAAGTTAIGNSGTEGVATSFARSDHTHAITAPSAPADVTRAAASAGASANFAREDHKHDVTVGTPSTVGSANAAGSASTLIRSDHVHDHGTQSTANHHAVASAVANGFMSAAQFTKVTSMYYDVVADGGADPLGVTDATAIINTAISTVAAAGGGIVFFPKGSYRVASLAATSISVAGNFVTLMGATSVASQIVTHHATQDVFNVTGSNIRFESLRIIANAANLRTGGYAINFNTGANNHFVYDVDFIYMHSCVKMTGQLIRIDQCNMRESGRNAINGQNVLIDAFSDHYLSNIVMDNGAGIAPGNVAPFSVTGFAGIRITNLSSLIVSNMQVIHCTTGLDVAPTGTNTIPSIYALNCFFDNSTVGASFAGAVGSFITRLRFIQCWFSSQATAGVILNNANIDGVDFVGCEFYGAPHGIRADSAKEWAVRASRFAGNTTNAIRTTAGATHSFTISDNYIGTQTGFGANAQGITIQAGTYARYQITENRGLETNTTPGLSDLGTATQKVLDNNLGALPTGVLKTLGATVAVPVTTETLVMATPVGANGVQINQVFRGKFTTVLAGANVCTWRTRIGTTGTVAGDTVVGNIVVTAAGFANGRSTYEFELTIRSLGAPGSLEGEGRAITSTAANAAAAAQTTAAAAGTVAVTTTASWFITVSLSQTINSSTVVQGYVEAL